MMLLHESLNTEKFKRDKKLQLLKNGVINTTQFANLIEPTDGYTMVGPAIIDKAKVNSFIADWKNSKMKTTAIPEKKKKFISQPEIIEKLDAIAKLFPETAILVAEFREQLASATCTQCVKNRYLLSIIGTIKPLYQDGRNLGEEQEFIETVINRYYPLPGKIANAVTVDALDIEWLKPDTLIGLGNDLIEGLDACFECAKKHLTRAKILYEEFLQGYPNHEPMMFNEFTTTNRVLEEAYAYYWDSLGQLDMASAELVGDFTNLPGTYQAELIELANEIRIARITYQEDLTKVPDWNKLRIDIQKLQNKTNKLRVKDENNNE